MRNILISLVAIGWCLGNWALSDSAVADGIVVVDDAGKTIKLERPATRVISLAPHITELIFTAGAGERLVGAVEYSDFPAAARDIRRIGSATNIDFERIVELKPDLVVGWLTGNPNRLIEKLESLSLSVYLSEPVKFEQVASTIDNIGLLTDSQTTANKATTRFRSDISQLVSDYSDRAEVSVFHPIWSDPLMSLGKKHIFSEILRVCGGKNIFEDLNVAAAEVSIETVLKRNPDLILGSSNDVSDTNISKLKLQWRKWSTLRAVKTESMFLVQSDHIHRPTTRLVDGIRSVCEILDKVRNLR